MSAKASYAAYQTSHMSRITYLVAPVMLAELGTAIYFAFVNYEPIDRKLFWFGLALVLIIWASTDVHSIADSRTFGGKIRCGFGQQISADKLDSHNFMDDARRVSFVDDLAENKMMINRLQV